MNKTKVKLIVAATSALVADLFVPVFSGVAQAAPPPQFTQAYVRFNHHKALTDTGGTICAKPSITSDDAAYIEVTFPTQSSGTDFVVSSTAAHWTVTTTGIPSGSTAWPGINTATSVTGKTVRFPMTSGSGVFDQGTLYCFNFAEGTGVSDRTLMTGDAGYVGITGVVHTLKSDGTTINEETNWATAVIADDTITVSAVVPPSFNFTLAGNTDAFQTNLNPAAIVSTTGVNFSIVTNAKGGWMAWIKDSNQGLTSATASYTINSVGNVDGSPTTLVADNATENYVLDADIITDASLGCTVGIDAEYNGADTSSGGTIKNSFQPVASCTGAAPATSNGDTVKLIERATIAGGTPAGSDYADVITVVAAGNF